MMIEEEPGGQTLSGEIVAPVVIEQRPHGGSGHRPKLSLEEVLSTPEFRYVFTEYTRKNLCAENVSFMLAVRAYNQLSEESKRKECAHRILKEFIDENAPAWVNLPSETTNELRAVLEQNNYTPRLFAQAYADIFNLTEKDVYSRFTHSLEFLDMVDKKRHHKQRTNQWRVRPGSFAVITEIENMLDLEDIIGAFQQQCEKIRDVEEHGVISKNCFLGSDLMEWLELSGKAMSNLQAVAYCQRLHDAKIIASLDRRKDQFGPEVWCTFDMSFFLRQSGSNSDLSVQRILEHGETVTSGFALLKGAHYIKCYLMYRPQVDKLYLFHSDQAKCPHTIFTECWLSLVFHIQISDKSNVTYIYITQKNWEVELLQSRPASKSHAQLHPHHFPHVSGVQGSENEPAPGTIILKLEDKESRVLWIKCFSEYKLEVHYTDEHGVPRAPPVDENEVRREAFTIADLPSSLQRALASPPITRGRVISAHSKTLSPTPTKRAASPLPRSSPSREKPPGDPPVKTEFRSKLLPSKTDLDTVNLKRDITRARALERSRTNGASPSSTSVAAMVHATVGASPVGNGTIIQDGVKPESGPQKSDPLDAEVKQSREEAISDLLLTEGLYITSLRQLLDLYLGPLCESMYGVLEGVSKQALQALRTSLEFILKQHLTLQSEMVMARTQEDKFFTVLWSNVDNMAKTAYQSYVHQYIPISLEQEEQNMGSSKFQTFVEQTKQKHGVPDFADLLLMPVERLQHYSVLIDRIMHRTPSVSPRDASHSDAGDMVDPSPPASPTQSNSYGLVVSNVSGGPTAWGGSSKPTNPTDCLRMAVNKLFSIAKRARESTEQSLQVARLVNVDAKVRQIPDDWKILTPSRVLLAQHVMTYLFETNQIDEDIPTHPFRDKRGETVRVILFQECLLLTTWKYKYRYRLDLNEVSVSQRRDLLLGLTNDNVSEDELLGRTTGPFGALSSSNTSSMGSPSTSANSASFKKSGSSSNFFTVPPGLHLANSSNGSISVSQSSTSAGSSPRASLAGTYTTLQCVDIEERDLWYFRLSTAIEEAKQRANEDQRHQALLQSHPPGSPPTSHGSGIHHSLMLSPASSPTNAGSMAVADGGNNTSKVNIFLRVRPFVLREEREMGTTCVRIDRNVATLDQTSVDSSRGDRVGAYTQVFGPESKQVDVFAGIGSEALGAVFAGFDLAIMTYGNTGAGKTYTMFGEGCEGEGAGVVPRLLDSMFEHLQTKKYHKFSVNVAYVQVYNDKVQDLQGHKSLPELQLKPANKSQGLAAKLKGLRTTPISSVQEAMQVVADGNKLRSTRVHSMNEMSSRSHAVFVVELSSQRLKDSKTQSSSIYLVDLAGSENSAIVGGGEEALQEAKEINKSLIALGRVINALNENARRTKGKRIPVPFRETKLTFLLQDVLTGDFLLSLILNASSSPALGQTSQTAKTMAFGDSVRKLGQLNQRQAADPEDSRLQNWFTSVWRSAKK